jgi:hypothetical protein
VAIRKARGSGLVVPFRCPLLVIFRSCLCGGSGGFRMVDDGGVEVDTRDEGSGELISPPAPGDGNRPKASASSQERHVPLPSCLSDTNL